MKKIKCCFALAVLCCFLCCIIYQPATAADKEETVYANLNYDGSLKGTYVVNAFKLSGETKILDFGNYKNIKNLSSDEKPEVKGSLLQWNVPQGSDSFYYQGEMENAQLPWNFNITYKLNGKKTDAKKLCGKSGNVQIIIEAKQNDAAQQYFKDNYIAQIAASFDSEKCKNIMSSEAIFANVGSTKQLTFMLIPGNDKTLEISMDAQNFEMDGMTIAFVKMSDGILSTVDSAKTSIYGISGNIKSLVSGTGELKNGASDLYGGLSMLNSGIQNLSQTGPMLRSGINDFSDGITSLAGGLSTLGAGSAQVRDGLSKLDSNSSSILSGISRISGGLNQMTKNKDSVKSGLNELAKSKSDINTMKSSAFTLKNGYQQVADGAGELAGYSDTISTKMSQLGAQKGTVDQLSAGASQIYNSLSSLSAEQKAALSQMGVPVDLICTVAAGTATALPTVYGAAASFGEAAQQMTGGAQSIVTNMNTLNNGFSQLYNGLDKVNTLYDAANTAANGAMDLIDGAEKLKDGCDDLYDGFDAYAQGVGTLGDSYSQLDNGINDAKSGADSLLGGASTLSISTGSIFDSIATVGDSTNTLLRGAGLLYGGTEQLDNGAGQFTGAVGNFDLGTAISMSENAEVVSFTAPGQNTPQSVEFVVKTPDIHLDDTKAEEETEQKNGFLQKLLSLFSFKTGVFNGILGIVIPVFVVIVIIVAILKKLFRRKKK